MPGISLTKTLFSGPCVHIKKLHSIAIINNPGRKLIRICTEIQLFISFQKVWEPLLLIPWDQNAAVFCIDQIIINVIEMEEKIISAPFNVFPMYGGHLHDS